MANGVTVHVIEISKAGDLSERIGGRASVLRMPV